MKEINVIVKGGMVLDVSGAPGGVRVKVVDFDLHDELPVNCPTWGGVPCRIEIWEGK